eukprot:scaffold8828_cov166-Skeletonema_dohrnii-CCMP3373.AAC.2
MSSSNSHTKINAIIVPTKQHDGGSNSDSDRANRVIHAAAAPKQKPDAFTKYSNNLTRMKELLLLSDNNEDGEEEDLDYLASLNDALRYASISDRGQQIDRNNHGHGDASCKRRKGNNSCPITQDGQGGFLERKTRISFEIHPSLLLHDLINLDVGVSAHIVHDDDEPEE